MKTETAFRKAKWGHWFYDSEGFEVVGRFPAAGRSPRKYSVSLSECRDSANVLDWIAQFAGKTWATPQQVGQLVIVLNDLIGFQRHICGGGRDKTIEPRDIVATRRKRWSK